MDNIEVAKIKGKGRGIVAKKIFKVGDLILKEDAFAVTVMAAYSKSTCHFCLNSNAFMPGAPPMLKCSGCNFARYCNRECQKKAWKDHKPECKAVRCVQPGIPADKTRLVARILWRKLRGEHENHIKINELDSHLEQRSEEDQKILDDHVFDFGDYFGYDDLPETDDELRHLFSIIDCNAIGINDKRGLQSLAVGIFPNAAMLNHSCKPNAVAINNGTTLNVRALRPIAEGDEICITYVSPLETNQQRREKLESQYYFECGCTSCADGCEEDKLKHAMLNDQVTEKSINYIEGFSKNVLKRIEQSKKKEDWERMSNQVLGALMQQDAVMADTHVLKMAVLNFGVEVHSYLQRHAMAVEEAMRVAEAYKKLLQKNHPVLGLWMMRLGILQWQNEKLPDSLVSLKEAASIISKTHGETHVVFTDIIGLIQQVMVESQMGRNARVNTRIAKMRAGHNLPMPH